MGRPLAGKQADFRYRDDVGFERRCPMCVEWWPITLEFWEKRWQSRCRACIKSWKRDYQNRKYRDDPAFRQTKIEAAAVTHWKAKQWRPDQERERRAAYNEAHADRRRERQRINYGIRRVQILERRRERTAAKRAAA